MSTGTGPTGPNPHQGRRFQPFFTAVCIWLRERSYTSRVRIADLAGVGEVSVKRFEEGKTFPDTNLDHYAAAYAYDSDDVNDGRDLMSLAVMWWKMHGKAPLTVRQERMADRPDPEPTAIDVLAAIHQAQANEAQRLPGEASTEPNATHRNRAARG